MAANRGFLPTKTMETPRPVTKCSQCYASIEDASLLLVCRHHLCLHCAAQSLSRSGKSGNAASVQCRCCQAITPVEDDAAVYLEGYFANRVPDVAASFVSSGPGSSTTQELSSPVLVGYSLPRTPFREVSNSREVRAKPPMASIGLDTNLDGKTDCYVTGVDRNCDGIPDILQGSQVKSLFQPLLPTPQSQSLLTSAVKSPPGSGHGSRAPSPRALELKTPRPVRTCGQCEERPADLHCEQCDELFCRSCAAAIHRRGQMSKHHLRLHVGSEEAATNEPIYKAAAVEKNCDPVAIVRKFLRCPVHPEEPLQFFCLTCECECICAECALHGSHRGHDVLNLREAARQLPEKIGDLNGNAKMRADEIATVTDRITLCHSHISNLVCASREELRGKMEQVRTGLLAEEKALMKEVERCFSEVASILQSGDDSFEGHVRTAEASLRHHYGNKDAIEALNAYSRLKTVLNAVPPPKHRTISAVDLKVQLEQSFKSRLASINSLSSQIENLWVAAEEPSTTHSQSRFTFGGVAPEADVDQWSNGPPNTPRFATASLSGFSPEQEPPTSMVLPVPQRSTGQVSKWVNPARFGS